jgi:hypothetical protein
MYRDVDRVALERFCESPAAVPGGSRQASAFGIPA